MDLLRSEAMQLVHLIIPNESAYWMISYLGLFQFNDLNASRSPFQRTYAAQIKLGELEAESLEINDNNEKLQRNYSEQLEDKLVLQRRHGMFLLIRSYYNSVGEFFHLAQSIAAAEQREQEVQQNGEGSIDSPL